LKALTAYDLHQGDLKFICNELKSLEFLHGSFGKISSNEFAELSKLKNLKSLHLSWNNGGDASDRVNESLFVMQSDSLTDLEINCGEVMENAVAQLGVNCPNLLRLNFESKASVCFIKVLVRSFRNLRSLVFIDVSEENSQGANEDPFEVVEAIENKKLIKLSVFSSRPDCQNFPKLLRCCKNLQIFRTSLKLNSKLLQNILIDCKRLEKLYWISGSTTNDNQISNETIATLKKFGGKLTHFYCEFEKFDCETSLEGVKQEMANHFQITEIRKNFRGGFEMELLRSGLDLCIANSLKN
jgi:hypothetical protein